MSLGLMMVCLTPNLALDPLLTLSSAYGDMNLFCSCAPVETIDGLTGAAAPMPT